ncbi:MAG: RsmB/NOP family class I SAM-dependent RNA methyltransferase [Hyphomicrobium sp.]|nr:RsmB/NOP family class I SAM-dependent RNA methyltransferase [Hyphomicrobium sp.]
MNTGNKNGRTGRTPNRSKGPRGGSPGTGGVRPAHAGLRDKSPGEKPRKSGLLARQLAARVLGKVMSTGAHLDETVEAALNRKGVVLEPRDRAFVRLLVATVLRHRGELDAVIRGFMVKPLPQRSGPMAEILLLAAAQLLILGTPAHAAIGLAVEAAKADRDARHFAGLANAVLRRVASEGCSRRAALGETACLNVPTNLLTRWTRTYGAETAHRIARASLTEPALDLTVASDADGWAERLHAVTLPTGTLRLDVTGRIEDLPGYEQGAWWVQDAAAALPARLLGDVDGRDIADLCAAPGGKTAQLAARGARVTAVDISEPRLALLKSNLQRLRIEAECVVADIETWKPGRRYDGVLLDAPCSATGTIRRHPEILFSSRDQEIERMAALQARLMRNAADLVKPGGCLVYCTCSLEPEESEMQIETFLAERSDFSRQPVTVPEIGGIANAVSPVGDLRTLPHLSFEASARMAGMDGFFAARLRRRT